MMNHSDERTMTIDSDGPGAAVFEETTIGWDVGPKGIETTLHQIATSLKNATVSYLVHGEYKVANTSWSKLQKKYHVSRDKVYTALKGRKDQEVPNTDRKVKGRSKPRLK